MLQKWKGVRKKWSIHDDDRIRRTPYVKDMVSKRSKSRAGGFGMPKSQNLIFIYRIEVAYQKFTQHSP